MLNHARQNGVTFIEFIIVVLIIAILAVGSIELVRLGFMSYVTGSDIIEVDWQRRMAFSRITQDLHAIRATSDITSATPNSLTFVDLNGNQVEYLVSGTSLMRNSQVLADHVQELTFKYYDIDGIELTTMPAEISSICYVTVTLAISKGTDFNFTTGVILWNLM